MALDGNGASRVSIIPRNICKLIFYSKIWFLQNSANGRLEIKEIVPDTITGWSISAFSINNDSGLGVIDYPVSLSVLKSFFVSVNLPYSIVKTETAIVEVFVHNYLDQDQEATVQVLNGQGEFQFVDEENETKCELIIKP